MVHTLIKNLSIGDQQVNLNYPHGKSHSRQCIHKLPIKNILLKGVIKS